jgi:hypothetical protein
MQIGLFLLAIAVSAFGKSAYPGYYVASKLPSCSINGISYREGCYQAMSLPPAIYFSTFRGEAPQSLDIVYPSTMYLKQKDL